MSNIALLLEAVGAGELLPPSPYMKSSARFRTVS
jgi:hypothetical protein